jgi:hypothetical protein
MPRPAFHYTFQYLGESSLGGWNFDGGAGLSNGYNGFTNATNPQSWNAQQAFIQGIGSISQNIADVSSGSYSIGINAAQRGGNTQDLAILVDGIVLATVQANSISGTYSDDATPFFNLSSGDHVIAIRGNDTGGGNTYHPLSSGS